MKKLLLLLIGLTLLGSFQLKSVKQRIFLIGDSTIAQKKAVDAPETGWGQPFQNLFTEAVEVHNHAVNGRSTKSFRTLGHWKTVWEQLQPGDYVFIQFGHNDSKESDSTRYAAPQTDYKKNLERYIREIQSKGAVPILVTPVMRRKFNDQGQFVDQHGEYPAVVRQIASSQNITLIDLHKSSQTVIEKQGVVGSKKMFMHYTGGIFPKFPKGIEDNTHFSPYGAQLIANAVASEIMSLTHPLRNFLRKSVYPTQYDYQLPVTYEPYFRRDTFNITRYGAIPDGHTLNTKAIQQAIDQANAAGGGVVYIPRGLWITGPIVLKSNVAIYTEKGALVQFSTNRDDYPIVETTWEGQPAYRCQAPISGKNLENIAILGHGIFDGSGDIWKSVKKGKLTSSQWKKYIESGGVTNEKKDIWYPTEQSRYGHEEAISWASKLTSGRTIEDYKQVRDYLRPNMLSLTSCENILIEGVMFQNSPAWTLHPLLCKHITIRAVQVKNPWYGHNNDALDLESCQYGVIEDCTFDTGDDAITIKSGRDEQGRLRGVPTSHFIVRNNVVFHAHGGFVIGSEMSGGVHDLYITNCSFLGSDIGLRFKTARGRGGVVENIYISDIQMNQIPGEAILFDMYYMAKDPIALDGDKVELPEMAGQPVNEGTPQFQHFIIDNVVCHGAETAILIRGLPEMSIKNIEISNSQFISKKGLICIEAENIQLKNVGIFTSSSKVMQIQNSQKIKLDGISYSEDKDVLLELNGEKTKQIRLLNSPDKAKETVIFTNKANPKTISRK